MVAGAARSIPVLNRIAVIHHGRFGTWLRQLRPRLLDLPVRWFESRSTSDLTACLAGLAFPVVVIDLERSSLSLLRDIDVLRTIAPDARTLVLDPEPRPE